MFVVLCAIKAFLWFQIIWLPVYSYFLEQNFADLFVLTDNLLRVVL